MAEVLVKYVGRFEASDGRGFEAQACAREVRGGLWEGWIEFMPTDGGAALRTGRETTQPKRTDAEYWATGLTAAYLQGALRRALSPARAPAPSEEVDAAPHFAGPAEHRARRPHRDAQLRPVLDPFAVYAEGDTVLRGQLNALDEGKLRTIARAYDLRIGAAILEGGGRAELVEAIVEAIEADGAARGHAGSARG